MKFLLDNSLVMWLANWFWGENEVTSPEECITALPFMTRDCWTTLIAKGAGIAIILGAFLNKAPVIANLRNSQSTEGLSRGAVYGDFLVYANAFSYGYLEGHPMTSYGESGALLVQTLVIIALIWQYSKPSISFTEPILTGVVVLIYLYVTQNMLPPEYHYLLMTINYPASAYARGSQIFATYQVKHTGANSIITTTLNVVGSLIRILTTIQEVGFDIPVLASYALGVVLNGICFIQHFVYWENTKEFVSKLEKSSNKGAGETTKGSTKRAAKKKEE